MEIYNINKRITNLVLLMKEEIKFVHKQIALPLFPVYYDIFLIDDLLLAPTIITSKYPGIDMMSTPNGSSMTCVAMDGLGNKGILALFSLTRQKEDPTIEDSIAFESSNLAWHILDILEITVDLDNSKVHSYLVQEIHKQITKLYKQFEENLDSNDMEGDSSSDDLGDM